MSELQTNDPLYAAFYAIFLRQAQGEGIKQSVESVGSFSYATYYRKLEQNPDLADQARASAFGKAAQVRKDAELLLLQHKSQREVALQTKVADQAEDVVTRILDIATDEMAADKDSIAAARAVREIAQGGFLFRTEGEKQQGAEGYEPIPYNPHTQSLTDMKLTLPPGSKVQVQVPAEGDAAIPIDPQSDP